MPDFLRIPEPIPPASKADGHETDGREKSVPTLEPSFLDPPSAELADPLVTASVYRSGDLDEVLDRAVRPVVEHLEESYPRDAATLWTLRYARGGEHLKIRLHGPREDEGELRDRLAAAVTSYLESLEPPEPDAEQRSREQATPIDREDEISTRHPDRSFLWTDYRRSHVCFGYAPFLDDEPYLARMAWCQGRGTELLLERLEAGEDGRFPHGAVQAVLLDALLIGLGALRITAEERLAYPAYHRDWLLRGGLKQSRHQDGPRKMRETLRRFDAQLEPLAATRTELERRAGVAWTGEGDESTAIPPTLALWSRSLQHLQGRVEVLCRDPSYHLDPFADNPAFPCFFKVFHGFANQLGLTPLNEAFAHHLLLASTAPRDLRTRPVQLMPDGVGRRQGVSP